MAFFFSIVSSSSFYTPPLLVRAMRKEKESRKEIGHTMKTTMEKNLKAADSFWYLRLDDLARLFVFRVWQMIRCLLFSHFVVFSFRVTWIRVHRGDPGNWGREKKSYDCNGILSEWFFATQISQVLNAYVLPCVCCMVYGVRCTVFDA